MEFPLQVLREVEVLSSIAFALSLAATIGYIIVRHQRIAAGRPVDCRMSDVQRVSDGASVEGPDADDEEQQTRLAVDELQRVSQQVRLSLAAHHACVQRFNQSVARLREQSDDESLRKLNDEAERLLSPTQQLTSDIAHAYDEIRRHTKQLSEAAH